MHPLGANDTGLVPDVSAKQEYWARFDDKDWSAAVKAAEILVVAARKDDNALSLAEALGLLGNAQLRNADLAGAETSFKEALKLVEASEGSASGHTLTPLQGLGFTLAAGSRHEEAVPYLDRALLIAHRTHGLFYADQQSILRQLANSLTYSGQPLIAERHVNYMLQVGERTYGQDDPKIVPLVCQVGDWHAEVGNFDTARRHYRDAIRLVEDKLGRNDVAIVLPLRRLAASYPKEMDFYAKGFIDPYEAQSVDSMPMLPRKENPRYVDTDGQRALLRALDVLEAQPDPPQQLLSETLIDVGDWYQFKQDSDKALPYYRKAAQVLVEMKRTAPETTQDPLAFPVRVYSPVPQVIARGNRLLPEQREEAFVQMEFNVRPDGTVEHAIVTGSNTHQRHIGEILEAMRGARFRPKFVDGEPVETTAMSFREVYSVKQLPKRESEDPS
jgi:tetratricopeptide (TPR) repeat protein